MMPSSYAKLKAENQRLRKHIYDLVENRDKKEGIEVFMVYKMLHKAEAAFMYGSITDNPRTNRGEKNID